MSTGKRIKELREREGFTQEELAERLNIAKQTIYKYEKSIITNIPANNLKLLATVLNSTPAYIMGWDDEDEEQQLEDKIISTFGSRTKNRRIALGMTQEELATKLGYTSKSSINKIELGLNDIPLSKVAKFAKVLDVSEAYLMGWNKEEEVSASKSNKEILAENLNHYMKMFRLSRKDMCEALNINYYTFSDWATGKKYPRIDKIEAIAKYLSISKSDLIEEHSTTIENPAMSDLSIKIMMRMKTNSEFSSVIERIWGLNDEQIKALKQLMEVLK